MPITLTTFCLYITSTQCKIEVKNISCTTILKLKLSIKAANVPAHNIKRTILKQKHNTVNSYHNNDLSISSDSDNQASLNKNQTTNLL